MKRIFALLLIALLMLSAGAEALRSTPGEFEIKAYKLKRDNTVTLTLVDALTGSLKEIFANEDLDIDGYYTPAIASSATADNTDDIAFAYRVSGNGSGTYSIKITVRPFEEQTTETKKYVISTRYFLVNETFRFLDSNKATTADYKEYENGGIEAGLIIENEGEEELKDSKVMTNKGDSVDLIGKFKVSGVSNNLNDFWIARGSVGFVVDSPTLKNANEGIYKALIEVELVTEGE